MSLFQSLLADSGLPPEPPTYNVTQFGPGNSRVAARQLALEPSVSGVDRAMSWSGWILCNNIGTQNMRPFCNMDPGTAFQQYSFNILDQARADSLNQHANFTLFNTANTGTIAVNSGEKFLRARWYHVVVTYDGSETSAGIKLYLQGVEDLAATHTSTGSYAGAGSATGYRFQAGAVLGGNFNGRMRDLAVWNRVLTTGEVVSLFNNGVPIDVDTLAFYAAAIEAYWPMRTNANCLNSATFNLGTLNSVTFGTYPLGPNYKFLSMFNGVVGNTAYLAFGSWANSRRIYTRSGTDHVTDGIGVTASLNPAGSLSLSALTNVITEMPIDLRNFASGEDVNLIRNFTGRYNGTVITDTNNYDSTDGLTGLTFGSRNDITSILPSSGGLTYGKVCLNSVAGDNFVAWYSGSVAGTYHIGIIKETGGVFSYISVYIGSVDYVEPGLIYCGGSTYIIVCRRLANNGLQMFSSTNNCVTWSAPAATGLGTGVCMGDGCLMPHTGKIVLIYADRTTGLCYVSTDNLLADVLANPLDWNAGSGIFQKYTFGANILGYPGIVADPVAPGCVAVFVSAEASSTRADLFVGYGQIEFS